MSRQEAELYLFASQVADELYNQERSDIADWFREDPVAFCHWAATQIYPKLTGRYYPGFSPFLREGRYE